MLKLKLSAIYLALLFQGCLFAQQQIITPSETNIPVTPGADFSLDINYQTSNGVSQLSGVGFWVHFNSNQLTYVTHENLFETGAFVQTPRLEEDTQDFDNNPDTNMRLWSQWADQSQGWPGQIPVRLYTLQFTANASFSGTSEINISEMNSAPGYSFTATPIQISMQTASGISIPDDNFRAFLLARYDSNSDGAISLEEAGSVRGDLNCSEQNIASLEGVQHFTGISVLNCRDNQLTQLPDISALTTLSMLLCEKNNLTQLPPLASLQHLRRLWCTSNALTQIPDLSGMGSLQSVALAINNLTSIPTLENLPALTSFEFHYNHVTQMPQFVNVPNLNNVNAAYNELAEDDCSDILELEGQISSLSYNPQRDNRVLSCPNCIPPVITGDPQPLEVCEGEQIQLSVSANSSEALSYQWLRDSQVLVGQTLSTLTLSGATSAQAGIYSCRVSNTCGTQTSMGAMVDVAGCNQEILISQNNPLLVSEDGSSSGFGVSLTGPPSAPVTVSFSSQDHSEVVVIPSTITFSPQDWDLDRLIQLRGSDDDILDGNQSVCVTTHPSVSDDPNYNGINPDDVCLTNWDNDQPNQLLMGIHGGLISSAQQIITIPVWVGQTQTYDIRSWEFDLEYNPNVLTWVSVQKTDTLSADMQMTTLTPSPGIVQIGAFGSQALTGEGTLVYLVFETANVAVGAGTDLAISNPTFNSGFPQTQAINGHLRVGTCRKGDLDSDGNTTQQDAALALMSLVDLIHPNYPIVSPHCADADCNGTQEGADAGLISRIALQGTNDFCTDPFNGAETDDILELSFPELEIGVGSSFSLPLNLSSIPQTHPLHGFQFTLLYDPEVIRITGLNTRDGLAQAMQIRHNAAHPGIIKVAGFHPEGITGSGLLLSLTGMAADEIGISNLILTEHGVNHGSPQTVFQPTSIKVQWELAPTHASAFILARAGEPAGPVQPQVIDPNTDDHFLFTILEQPQSGRILLDTDGLVWLPDDDATGGFNFRFQAMDRAGLTVEGTGLVQVVDHEFFTGIEAWRGGTLLDLISLLSTNL